MSESEEPLYEIRWLQAVVLDLRYLFPERVPPDPADWAGVRRPRFLVERHARKLAWWREDCPLVLGDLPWRWVPTLRADRVAEVLIEEDFGTVTGVRHLFRVDDRPNPETGAGVVWGLGVFRDSGPTLPSWVIQVIGLRLFSLLEREP